MSLRRIALCACAVAAAAAPVGAGDASAARYTGKTSKGLPVSFRVAGGKVRNFSASAHALCISVADASSYLDSVIHLVTPPAGKIKKSGRFHLKLEKGSTRMEAGGRVKGKTASGTYSISYDGFNGRWVTACNDSGKWKARRR